MIDREGPHDGILREVRVLILVDEDVLVAGILLLADFGILFQEDGNMLQQVIEVNRVGPQ
jgi:hypothetical protein